MTGCRPASWNCTDAISRSRNQKVGSTYSGDGLYLGLALEGDVHLSNARYLSARVWSGINGCGLLLEFITLVHFILVTKEHLL